MTTHSIPVRRTRPHKKASLFREHRPQSLWLPRRPTKPCPPRISYVYLLVHAGENRFKIGHSYQPSKRIQLLPEAMDIDESRSLRVELPNGDRARQVESALHKALAGFRLQRLNWCDAQDAGPDAPWDGSTEWFSLPGLRSAIQILRSMPATDSEPAPPLQALNGRPYVFDHSGSGLTAAERRTVAAMRFNAQRLDHIDNILLVLSRRLAMEWVVGSDPARSAGILKVHGLKSAWEPDMIRARFALVSSSLWNLQTGRSKPSNEVSPLVRLIRYSATVPGTLELVVNSMAAIRKLPSGRSVECRWASMMGRYAAHRS
jgi:hypothetical protein